MIDKIRSTLSSGYNSLSAVIWEDFTKAHVKWSDKKAYVFCKVVAALSGILSIIIAFAVGTMESIVQATTSFTGASGGPLFSVFFLGILVPSVKAGGALTGLIGGLAFNWWLSTGGLIYPRQGDSLPSSTEGCSDLLYRASNLTLGSFTPPPKPEGILQFYHVSFMWFNLFGFIAAIVFAMLGSLIFDRFDKRTVDEKYVAPQVRKFLRTKEQESNHVDIPLTVKG